ncbi:MAG: hypothetical protein NT117_08045 [Gammaproteobacteria bacterium]|nr:hypothetical protein [Gammaproteobacteria bacterium]
MSSATLCFSGFSRDELAQVQQLFEQANAGLGQGWSLAPEPEAQVLVIDMDSMYGHMTWLKAASGGKTTVGMTAGDRCETDFLLKRPVNQASLRDMLAQVSKGRGQVHPPTPTPEPLPTPKAEAVAPDAMPEDAPASVRPSADYIAAITTGKMAALPANAQPHQPAISDLLAQAKVPARIRVAGAPDLLVDPASQTYAGSSTLKPLLPYVDAVIEASDAIPAEMAEFDRAKLTSGGAQPFMRLLWLCGLTVGKGQLLPGFSETKKFVLTKWPQIEREFPKHFRLATVMMKGPAFARDIAEASGVSAAEVIDFINAGLVTGAVVAEGAEPAGGDLARASALLARPRAG